MKKLFVIFLSIVYLVLSSGFTQYSHICKGTATEKISLTNMAHQGSDKPCSICSAKEKGLKDKKKNCCKHESKIVKVDDVAKKQSKLELSVKFWGDAIPSKMLETLFDFLIASFNTKTTHYLCSKVPIRGNPLYILHCVYRI